MQVPNKQVQDLVKNDNTRAFLILQKCRDKQLTFSVQLTVSRKRELIVRIKKRPLTERKSTSRKFVELQGFRLNTSTVLFLGNYVHGASVTSLYLQILQLCQRGMTIGILKYGAHQRIQLLYIEIFLCLNTQYIAYNTFKSTNNNCCIYIRIQNSGIST